VCGGVRVAQAHADSGYVTSVLEPTLLIAVGIGLTFPTLMAAATADAPEADAGIIGGLANTTSQVGGCHHRRNSGRRRSGDRGPRLIRPIS
jgi:hypothetical protein